MKAILFDLDNTLTHRKKSIENFSELFISEFGDRLGNVRREEIFSVIVGVDNGGYLSKNAKYPSVKDTVSHALLENVSWVDKPSFQQLREFWIECMAKCSIPMEGVPEILTTLKDHSFLVGIVSNGSQSSRNAVIKALHIEQFLDVLISSGEVGVKKPEAEIFHLALNQLGIDTLEAWFVGDHPINDVIGAQSAGLKPVWLKGFHDWPEHHQYPEYTISALDGLKYIVT